MLPGGRAPEYLRLNEKVLVFIKHFLETNKPVAVICHGIQLLSATGLIAGKKLSCYPACQVEVKLAGGHFQDIQVDEAYVDGNIVTSPAWPAHPKFLQKFVQLLGDKIVI